MIRTFRYPLRPNKSQETVLTCYIVRCQQLYNAALEQRRDVYRKQKRSLTRYDQHRDLTELRQHDPDFGAVPATILRSSLNRLDEAFQAFFRRVKTGDKPGFPRFKSKDRYDSFSFLKAPLIEGSRILVPKLGYVKFHQYRPLKGTPLDCTIRRERSGKWVVCIQCNVGEAPAKIVPTSHVGIDVGLTNFATLSTGEQIPNPRFFRASEDVLARRQQALELKKRGSNTRLRQKQLVAKTHLRIHNQRLDFVRKLASVLVARFDLIAYEQLNINRMVRGNLSKSIFDASWGMLINAIMCKAEEAGKLAVAVDPRGTSQRCSGCGQEPSFKKKLSDRRHRCACGISLDRDHNAALNIDALGLSALVA